jgi:hypothetical protein
LLYSAEKLIGHLVGIASGLGASLFLMSVVFTGIEFDDVFLGVALNLEDFGGVTLGVAIGTALSMTGVVRAIAAILTPARVSVARDCVLVFAGAPLILTVCTLVAPLTAADGSAAGALHALRTYGLQRNRLRCDDRDARADHGEHLPDHGTHRRLPEQSHHLPTSPNAVYVRGPPALLSHFSTIWLERQAPRQRADRARRVLACQQPGTIWSTLRAPMTMS